MNSKDKVLFVDDDSGIRLAFSRSLEREGFSVDVAANATAALTLAEHNAYGVVVLDYRMPDTTGLELQDRLKVVLPDSTYILVSGSCDLDVALSALNEHGISYVIPKPWVHEELVSKLNRALELSWERTAARRLEATMMEMNRDPVGGETATMVMSRGTFARVLLRVLNLREPATGKHCEHVAQYARLIGVELNLSGDALRDVELAARLHDIGKLSVPSAVLAKTTPLSVSEWQYVYAHPQVGADIIGDVTGMDAIREMVLQHHERWDGRGYPNGLKGAAISLGAQILAVADAVDAMLSDRPFVKGLPLADVRQRIEDGIGGQFAPAVAEAFLALRLEASCDASGLRKERPTEIEVQERRLDPAA